MGYPGDARVTGSPSGLHVVEIATETRSCADWGLSDDDLATLRDQRVIGERVLNAYRLDSACDIAGARIDIAGAKPRALVYRGVSTWEAAGHGRRKCPPQT